MSKTFYVFKKFANLKKSLVFEQNQKMGGGGGGGSAQFLGNELLGGIEQFKCFDMEDVLIFKLTKTFF